MTSVERAAVCNGCIEENVTLHVKTSVSVIKEVTSELDLIRTKVHMYSEAWNIVKKMFSLEP